MSTELLAGKGEASPLAFWGGRTPPALLEAQSPEARIIERAYGSIGDHYSRPISRLRSDPVRRFYELVWSWRIETATLSDTDTICTHPAYQQVIGMGATALPFIFRE